MYLTPSGTPLPRAAHDQDGRPVRRTLRRARASRLGASVTMLALAAVAAGCSSENEGSRATADRTSHTSDALGRLAPGGGPELSAPDPLANGPAQFKLLIIAPAQFTAALRPLVNWKNASGMPTSVATVEDIRLSLAPGDDAAKIKDLIRSAVTNHGARYVMIAGDANLIPARHEIVRLLPGAKGPHVMDYYPTDLYYANLWTNHDPSSPLTVHGGFSTWDANGDGKYNDFYGPANIAPPPGFDILSYNPDNVDVFADVAVGRLPAHTPQEVTIYANKVLAYESGGAQSGTAPFGWITDGGYPEAAGLAEHMQSTLPASLVGGPSLHLGINYRGPVPAGWTAAMPASASSTFGGVRWLTYVGHGSVFAWHDVRNLSDLRALTNGDNLPIVFAAACDTSQFKPNVPYSRYRAADDSMRDYGWDDDKRTAWDKEHGDAPLPYPFAPPEPSIYDADPPMRGMAAAALIDGNHGAIAYLGDAQTTQNGKPVDFGAYMLAAYAGGANVLGDAYVAGQRAYWAHQRGTTDTFASPRMYLNTMTFAGDPSLRIKPLAPTTSPTVRGLSPASGVGAGGTIVAIDGTGFDVNSTRVFFGTKPATVVNCPSSSSCFATSPPGAGTVDVVLVSGYGLFAATSASTRFQYRASAPTCTISKPSCGSVWLSCESTPDALSYQWQNADGTWGNPIMFAGQASISGLLSANPYAIRFCAGNALGTACGNAQSFSPDLTGRLTSCTDANGSKMCGQFANNCGGTLDCGACPIITTCAGKPKPLAKCSTSWRCCDSDGWTCGYCQ